MANADAKQLLCMKMKLRPQNDNIKITDRYPYLLIANLVLRKAANKMIG